MSFGFRVYSFQVTERNKHAKSALELNDSRVTTLQNAIEAAWRPTVIRDGLPGWRTILDDLPATGDKGDDRILGVNVDSTDATTSIEVQHGRIGQSPYLLPETGASENISKRAPAHGLRHDFYFPSRGKCGIIVAEVANRHSALTPLLRWTSRLEGLSDNSNPKHWHRYRTLPLGDEELLKSIITNSEKTTIEFKGNQIRASGREGVPLQLSLPVDGTNHAQVAEVILKWMQGNRRNAVKKLLRATGFKPKKIGDAQLSFTMPKIRISGEEKATITPFDIDDIFTYTISADLRPTDAAWDSTTQNKVTELATAWSIPLRV